MNQVTIVTVAYNSEQVLPAMLKSLPSEVDLILVDNAKMEDAELKRLQALRSFQYIACETNLGFGAACNRGAAMAKTEFVFFLNPDATLEEGCVDTLVDALASRPECCRWLKSGSSSIFKCAGCSG